MPFKSKYKDIYYCLVSGLCLMLTLIIGCANSQSNEPNSESVSSEVSYASTTTATSRSVKPNSSVAPLSTNAVTPSITPSQTSTATLIPSLTPTATHTPTPTLTPLPTISPEQRGQRYIELMNNNGGCELPCWWGFKMGKTSLDEIRQFYTTFDPYFAEQIAENGVKLLEILFVDPQIEDGEQTRHTFVVQDNIVIEAVIHLNQHPDYQIKPILQQLGQPTDAWMWAIPEPIDDLLPTRYYFYFPERGVFLKYATGGEKVEDDVTICFDGRGGAAVHLWDPDIWDPDKSKNFMDRISASSEAFIYTEYHPIEEVSNWNAEQLYIILTDPSRSECLKSPSSHWPSPY